MKKLLVAIPLLSSLLLVSCGGASSEKDMVVDAGASLVCLMSETMATIEEMTSSEEVDFEALGAMQADLETKMIDIVKAAGFADQDEFQAAAEKYPEDEMKNLVIEAAKAKCELSDELAKEIAGDL